MLLEDGIPLEFLCSNMFSVCLQVLFEPQGGFKDVISSIERRVNSMW